VAPIRLPKSANASLLDEAHSAANCMVLHPACHNDSVGFYDFQADLARQRSPKALICKNAGCDRP
jgi:hypothetical protein